MALAGSGVALGQFSNNPASLEAACDASNEQTQSKIAVNPDGSFYVSWFDQRTGGYDVYLQRYNGAGVEQWAHNGILVADRTVSSTNDWDLDVDASGNAIVSYGNTSSSVAVSKVDATGAIVWTTQVSTGSALQPKAAVLSDGNIMVGWVESGVKMQKVNSSGALVGSPISITETGHYVGFSDVQPGDNGSVIVLWIRGSTTSSLSNKVLYAQKYDSSGVAMWAGAQANGAVGVYAPVSGTPYAVGVGTYPSAGGSIQNGYQPNFFPDGSGGAVFGWYENVGPRSAYVQHVASNGTVSWPVTGLPVGSDVDTGFIKTGAGLSYDASTGDMYVAWPRTNASTQSIFSMKVQKISAAGALQWGTNGVDLPINSAVQPSFVQTVQSHGGCFVLSLMGAGTASGTVMGAYVSDEGVLAWPGTGLMDVCSAPANKGRLSSARTPGGAAVFSFNQGSGSSADILLGNIRRDQTQGTCKADLGKQGGVGGPDGALDNNDFISFIDLFFSNNPLADLGSQGGVAGADTFFDNNDFVIFIDEFFSGCE
jgi:hypothetical protein